MADITLTSTTIVIELSRIEKLLSLRRRDIRLPLSAVRDVRVEREPLRAAKGLRAPGLAIPLLLKIGTWRRVGDRAFVSARRTTSAVAIRLHDAELDAILVSTPNAPTAAAAIERAAAAMDGTGDLARAGDEASGA